LAVVFPFSYEAGVNFPEIRYQLSIGEYAIIGAGAVVIRSIPAKCTAVGVLEKVVKIKE
jgi:serine acetyltransferase